MQPDEPDEEWIDGGSWNNDTSYRWNSAKPKAPTHDLYGKIYPDGAPIKNIDNIKLSLQGCIENLLGRWSTDLVNEAFLILTEGVDLHKTTIDDFDVDTILVACRIAMQRRCLAPTSSSSKRREVWLLLAHSSNGDVDIQAFPNEEECRKAFLSACRHYGLSNSSPFNDDIELEIRPLIM